MTRVIAVIGVATLAATFGATTRSQAPEKGTQKAEQVIFTQPAC